MEGRYKVAIVAMNQPKRYSGGRIHTLWVAYGMAANGYEVVYYTNAMPSFVKDFPNDKVQSQIHFHISKWNMWRVKNERYKLIIVVPHGARRLGFLDSLLFYPFASKLKKKNQCKMMYLDFESPNWIKEVDSTLRPMKFYKYSNHVVKHCDAILSTTSIGSDYAKVYYSKLNPHLLYYQLYLCINAYAGEGLKINEKEESVLFIARFGQKHKGNNALLNIVEVLPEGYVLNIIGNKDAADSEFITDVENLANDRNVELNFYKGISDKEKFELMAKSLILFFPSKFEGYGLPPLEAQYMGASVICSNLPVLREVNPMAIFVDFDRKEELKEAVKQVICNPPDPYQLRNDVEGKASPKKFIKNLGNIIKDIQK